MNKVVGFLPQDYEAPKTSNFYMKLQDGENKFRILTQPILGWEDWVEKKPVRYAFDKKPAKSVDPKKPIKHFWAMVVWNYAEEQIQILHITQATIRNSIQSLCNDSDWGAPYFYDLKIIRKGEGMETEYMVNPLPHKPLPAHVKEAFNERPCNLDALFDNGDPFDKECFIITPGIFSHEDIAKINPSNVLTSEKINELQHILDECDPKYKALVMKAINKEYHANSLSEIPVSEYERVKAAAIKNMEETHAKQRSNFKEAELFAQEAL